MNNDIKRTKKCPDCGGNLEEGYPVDNTYGGFFIQRYAQGEHKKVIGKKDSLRFSYKNLRRVLQYRCSDCGRIFSYAQDLIITKDLGKRQTNSILFILAFFFLMIVIIIVGVAISS